MIVCERDDFARPNLSLMNLEYLQEKCLHWLEKKIDIDGISNAGYFDHEFKFYTHYEYFQLTCRQNDLVEYIAQPDSCNCILDPSVRLSSCLYTNTIPMVCTFIQV